MARTSSWIGLVLLLLVACTDSEQNSPPDGQTVAPPTFDPPAGQVASGTVVTVSTTTPGATILLGQSDPPTTDGTTFTVTENGTWYARATLDGWADSSVVSAGYTVSSSGTVTRPPNNTGSGFFVSDGLLYDATGTPFVMRGVNKAHYDTQNLEALGDMNANAVRWVLYHQTETLEDQLDLCQDFIDHDLVPIPGNWDGTCDEDPETLSAIVDIWVDQAAAWQAFEQYAIISVANEWGPSDSDVWRDAAIDAVARLRQAGYRHTLMIDAAGCGQDAQSIIDYGQEVFDSDPEGNVIFGIHIYGAFYRPATEQWQQDYDTALGGLASLGLVIVAGEFGPGRDIGPSPTMITPGTIITTADGYGWGWLAWAADDNNLENSMCDGEWFCMLYDNFGPGSGDNLTEFGADVVLDPTYGLVARAERAAIFE